MYNSPQTFFDDESPPTSPVDTANLPTFHLSPAPPGHKAERSEHRRWNSLARPKPHPLPFSYEYIFEDGKLAGLAEYHPEQDFLHYSSSRGSSAANSRNPSRRTSAEHSTRSSTDTRYSHSSGYSHGAPPSPRTTDKIKRALSLSRTRGQRRSSDKKRKIPSPTLKPRGIGLEFLTSAIPVEPATPTKRDIPILPFESPRAAPPTPTRRTNPTEAPELSPASIPLPFESPRAAPQPPPKPISKSARPVPEPTTAHQIKLKRKDSKRKETKNNGLGITRPRKSSASAATEGKGLLFEGPKRPPLVNTALERAFTQPIIFGALQTEKVLARPPLRRNTSKFIEHLDDKPIKIEVEAEKNGVPAVPFSPPFDFMLPAPKAQPELPPVPQQQRRPRQALRRLQTVARRDPNYTHPEWPSIFHSSPTKSMSTPPARTVPKFALGPSTQLLPNHIVRKRSASNMKVSESVQPVSTSLKRATSMHTRPPTMWADVCMAEVKPTLMSPVVASGHARMISC